MADQKEKMQYFFKSKCSREGMGSKNILRESEKNI